MRRMNLLFLCSGNSCRSQMAEGWARNMGGEWLNVESAGIEAHGRNPRAIAAMEEAGVDICAQESTKLTDDMVKRADCVVTVCGGADERCPSLLAGLRKEHWPVPDPALATGTEEEVMEVFRDVRDEIKERVSRLIEQLTAEVEGAQKSMSAQPEAITNRRARDEMGLFERYLTLWVGVCIVAGVAFGHFLPGPFRALGRMEYANVNIPVAILVWVMIIPMLLKVDIHALAGVRRYWRAVGVTVFVNWMVKPFSMALLAWVFIKGLFGAWLPPDQTDSYIAGLILLSAAPCTAMVFVWSNLSGGEPHFTLTQVALNDVIMIFAFAPIVGLLLGLSSITVPWDTLFLSVVLYIVIPLVIANLWRWLVFRGDGKEQKMARTLKALNPWSLGALLTTLILLFGFQGEQILRQPVVIALLAVPITIQVFFNSTLAYLLNRAVRSPHCVAGPSALIGASNFFELAVAVAISLFGFASGAALATVVGVLVEVPVMLLAVKVVNRTRGWYEQREGVATYAQCCPAYAGTARQDQELSA